MHKVFDHIRGATTHAERRVTPAIGKILASAEIRQPVHGYLDIKAVDAAFAKAGFSVQKRLAYKAELARAGIIAP